MPTDTCIASGKETAKMSILQKKAAIQGALSSYLNDDRLGHALLVWEEKYSQQPTFALQRFINEFCDNSALSAQRSKILQSLIKALSGADGRPLDKPMGLPELNNPVENPAPATIHPASDVDESIACCTQLIETVFSLLPGDMHIKTRLYLIDNLPGMKLNAMTQRAVHAWLSQQYRIPGDIHMEEKALRHLINLTYISLCEFLGPIKADRTLHEAIVATEMNHSFPVRHLL